MGQHFPSSDERWKGTKSTVFVEEVVRLLGERGWTVGNVDATIVAQAPALAAHLDAMRDTLAQHLGVARDVVSVKAKSPDGIGAVGRAEGIAAQATVLLMKKGAS
jgi:2-C-methyl-D-erythritol 2,4-cyclodiphosphate synthase